MRRYFLPLALSFATISLATVSLATVSFAAAPPKPVPAEDTWDFSAVYPSVEAWKADMEKTSKVVDGLSSCKGQLKDKLKECLERRFDVQKTVNRLYTYSGNLSSVDTRDATLQGRAQEAEMLFTTFSEVTSFYRPEIIAMGGPAVEAAIAKDPGLAPYARFLRATVVDAPHTLDAAGETMLAAMGNVLAGPGRARGQLVNAELPWPKITLSDGSEHTLTPAVYTNLRGLSNRDDRKKVFNAFFGAYRAFEGTLGATMGSSVEGDWTIARARHYETSVAAAIDVDHVPQAVYETLVAQTNKNLPTLHRYLKFRAKMLGVSDLSYPDMYPPLVKSDREWTVAEAKAVVLEASKPLGTDYVATLQKGFSSRWMDVWPTEGKQGGAYMDGAAYDVHPFLLLNYTGDYESVSTLAHEWGHALHSVLSSGAQPYPTADYSTFTAEIASTFNEALLLQQMLKTAKDDDERLFYLGNALEGLRTTYFRQAQLAEFELAMHQQIEKGDPLTGASLTATYLGILKRYYGHDANVTKIDDLYGVEWAYIPHFYNSFYVYQYATSIAAASLFADDIMAKKAGALDRYLGLLKAGGSDDPYVLLKNAGVDMATPAPYDAIAKRMNAILDEMEAIQAKQAKAAEKAAKKKKK